MNKNIFFIILILQSGLQAISQTIVAPNYILKSHETLEVMMVRLTEEGTIIQMSIRNERDEGGTFCINKNTEIIANDISYRIQRIENIPECPKAHKFESAGEELTFNLYFPAIPKDIKIIDIIENCNDNCFRFVGLIIDEQLNLEMNLAFNYFESGLLTEGLSSYKDLLKKYENKEPALEGLFYFYIITILREMGQEEEASRWLEQFQQQNPQGSQWVYDRLTN